MAAAVEHTLPGAPIREQRPWPGNHAGASRSRCMDSKKETGHTARTVDQRYHGPDLEKIGVEGPDRTSLASRPAGYVQRFARPSLLSPSLPGGSLHGGRIPRISIGDDTDDEGARRETCTCDGSADVPWSSQPAISLEPWTLADGPVRGPEAG